MVKKVIDIFPPNKKSDISKVAYFEGKELEGKIAKPKRGFSFAQANVVSAEQKKRFISSLLNKKLLILGLLVLISLGVFGFFTLPKAVIEVWPRTEIQTFKVELKIDREAEALDFENKIIPGEIFKEERTVADVFSSSAKVLEQGKAEGIVRVFNKHSFFPQSFIPRTRFMSAEGKVFRTPVRIIVPGKSREGGKIIPGHIDIRVVADVQGKEHNIGPSTFSIPGLVGTELFVNFYAESFESMAGGFSREVIQVTEQDLEKAEDILSERAEKESQTFFENKIREKELMGFAFFAQAIQTEIVEVFSLAKPGMEMENFNFQVRAKSKALIFKEQDLKDFAREFIETQIAEEKQIHQPSLKIDYSLTDFDLDQGKMGIALEISVKIYPDINIPILENALKGKSLLETKDFLEARPEIIKAKPEFWPFWVNRAYEKINFFLPLRFARVPEDLDKIEIKLKFESGGINEVD